MPPRSIQVPAILTTQISLLQTFTSFLTVAIHTILYARHIYPAESFLLTRAYNLPVRQNRHPDVCAWITSTCREVEKLMRQGTVARVVVPIHTDRGEILERFIFDVSRFPEVPPNSLYVPFEERPREGEAEREDSVPAELGEEDAKLKKPQSVVDIEEQLRATIRKLAYTAENMGDLPEDCTFTVAVELKDSKDAQPPIEHLGIWEPSVPELQTGDRGDSARIGKDVGGAKTLAVRNVEAGEFVLESWVEEGMDKLKWIEEERERNLYDDDDDIDVD
ncbi:HORMA domain-containing protein [Phlyctema vagabunda]|uniref:HORMA domain-containing protein n=1 Tax=Phlyctema vagabunda TaxID=108571 RepID=A0ABR4P9N9_9HELO